MGPLACVASFSVRFSFSDSRSISHAAKTFRFLGNPVTRPFFAPKPNGNACYAGYGPFAEYVHMVQKTPCCRGWQTTQRGKENKETSFKKLVSFLSRSLRVVCHPARCFLHHVTIFCKGPILFCDARLSSVCGILK